MHVPAGDAVLYIPWAGADRRGRRALRVCMYRLVMPFFAYPGLEQIGAAGARWANARTGWRCRSLHTLGWSRLARPVPDDLQALRRMICKPVAGHWSDAINGIAGGGAARWPRTNRPRFTPFSRRKPPRIRRSAGGRPRGGRPARRGGEPPVDDAHPTV